MPDDMTHPEQAILDLLSRVEALEREVAQMNWLATAQIDWVATKSDAGDKERAGERGGRSTRP
jgi:hypothetical protein